MKLNASELNVVRVIHQHKGISRKGLAQNTGLSQASITKITRQLFSGDYIVEGERIGDGMGRKEVMLYTNPLKFRFLGIDIGGYRLRIAIADNNLDMMHEQEWLMTGFAEVPNILEDLVEKIEQFLSQSGTSAEAIDAIGVGVTGIVDPKLQVILNIPNRSEWSQLAIVDKLSSRFSCPVFLDEGGRTMARAEKMVGKAKQVDDFIVVHVAFGIVAGIMINGQLLRGSNNAGGLLGHITADESAGRCLCGNYGCLENIVTFLMIENDYKARGGQAESVVEAYRNNDKIALEACLSAGRAMGIALSNVINLFNPQVIYIGGPVFEQMPILFEETKRTILIRANRFAVMDMQMEASSFGNKEGLMGALSLASSSYIS